LKCVPTEAFLWFVHYWTDLAQGTSSSRQIDSLLLSYRLGPNEGWIATRRNVYALAVYDLLPAQVQGDVRTEFAGLVASGLLTDAFRSLTGPGWPHRDLLLPELTHASLAMRQYFSKMLVSEGIEVDIPGVERPPPRIWQ
jgi:hypothetical protein